MGKIKKYLRRNLRVRPSFFIYVAIYFLVAIVASGLTVQIVDKYVSTVSVFYIDGNEDVDRVNEDRDEDIKIAVELLDEDFSEGTSNAILFYSRNWMVFAAILIYFLLAICLAAHNFYKRKLDIPLRQLQKAAAKISEKDLDFEIEYSGNDEMGQLCQSFEMMRKQLAENNAKMWNMIDEQKRTQHILAHDIRTPLTVTKGYVEILREYMPEKKLSEEKIQETIECIHRNIVRIESFVNVVSKAQKIDDIVIKNEKVDVMAFFDSLKDNAEIIREKKMLKFTCFTDNPVAFFDKQAMEQIIFNLISNASRYAKNEIQFDCTYRDNHFTFTVSDDGKGFSDEALMHAFEPYFTEESKQTGEHFGIGLSTCKSLCEKLGGKISCYNHFGAVVKVEI